MKSFLGSILGGASPIYTCGTYQGFAILAGNDLYASGLFNRNMGNSPAVWLLSFNQLFSELRIDCWYVDEDCSGRVMRCDTWLIATRRRLS